MDGCQGTVLGVVQYGALYWKCGDVCTSAYGSTAQSCTCGNSTFKHGDGKWCCGTNCTGGNCLRWREKADLDGGGLAEEGDKPWYCLEWSPANCTTGVALNLTESCPHKYKCNENQQDKYRNLYTSRSALAACSDNRTCVKEGEGGKGYYKPTICTGDSSCEGELAWCKKEERKNETCPGNGLASDVQFTRCLPTLRGGKKKDDSESNGIPGQCIHKEKAKDDKIFHCMDRTDENPFKEAVSGTNQQQIGVDKLKTCKHTLLGAEYPGLQCDGSKKSKCISMNGWCNDEYSKECPVLGSGIRTNNLAICKEYKLWQDKPCDDEDYIRCRAGYSGQCVQKEYWGVKGAKDEWWEDVSSCKDGSDLYRPIVKGEEAARQPSQQQVWKTWPMSEKDYNEWYNRGKDKWYNKGKEGWLNYMKENKTGLWMITESDPFKVPSVTEDDLEKGPRAGDKKWEKWEDDVVLRRQRKEEWADFYSSENYVKDETTNRMMAPTTEETCKANNGFVCKVRGVETCFKETARCNLHAECDPAEGSDGTAEDELDCDAEYRRKRLIPRQATYRCQSPYHNDDSVKNKTSLGVVWIWAALNDGNPECWMGEDEIERSTFWEAYVIPGISLASLVIVTISLSMILPIFFRNGFPALPGGNTILKIFVDGSTTEVKKVLAEQRISSSLAQLQKLDLPRERRRRINRKIVVSLAAGQAQAFAKLKKMARRETSQEIIDDFTHSATSFTGKCKDNIGDLKDFMKKKYHNMFGQRPTTHDLGSRLFGWVKMTVSYIDIVRDTILLGILIKITGYKGFFSEDITLFPNVVILILLATVAVPTFVSAVQTSARHPLTIFEFSGWNYYRTNPAGRWELIFIRFMVFTCYIFVPAILISNRDKATVRRQSLEEQAKEEFNTKEGIVTNATMEEQELIEAYLDEVRKARLIFKRNEAALELVAQQSIQLMMLLLSRTKYPVVTGLQQLFSRNVGDLMLMLSICWSFKTAVASFLKIHSEQKARMMSGAAKVVLGLRALLFSVTRIVCVVAFFGPFLGLGDSMAHWHAEEIQLDKEIMRNLNGSTSYWDRETVDLMYREQDYTNYTLVTLQQAFFIFLGFLLLYGIAILILKINVSSHFKSTGWLNKIGHVVESLHVPDVYKDFDVEMNPEEERTPEDYRKSYDSVLKETLCMTSLQMLSNLLLLVPLHVTAFKVSERHSALVANIGTFAEEDEAHELLNRLSISLPIVAMVTWVLDALLGYAYLKWFHPWRILLQEEPDQWEPETEDKAEMEQEIQEDTAGSATAEEHEDSPLLVRPSEHKVDLELELHSCASSDQV